jgi:DNA-nicking Smr family endonuclease
MASGKKKKKGKENESGPFEALRALRDELESRAAAAKASAAKAPASKHGVPRAADARGHAPAEPRAGRAANQKATGAAPSAGDEPESEALLFHRLFAGVEPLDRSRGRVPRDPLAPSPAAAQAARRGKEQVEAEGDAVRERLRTLVEGGSRFEVADDGRCVEGRREGVPAEVLRRLRRGQLPIDARIDLHGMRAADAHREVDRFLAATHGRGERCVLLIHGKGEHSPLGVGVLRGEIAAWLSQGSSSRHVAAFATALERDGGAGAIYVLLRR